MTAVLSVRGLAVSVGSRTLLEHAWLDVRAGETVGVIGANGVGKTTLLRTLAGLRRAGGGSVEYGPTVVDRPGGRLNGIGFAPARLDAPGKLTAAEYLDVLTAARGVEQSRGEMLTQLGFDSWGSTAVEVLSTGERKKLGVAAALVHAPALAVLDEPFEALDEESAWAVVAVLADFANAGGALIVCTHRHRFLRRSATAVHAIRDERLVRADAASGFGAGA